MSALSLCGVLSENAYDIRGGRGRLLPSWPTFAKDSFRHINSEISRYQVPSLIPLKAAQ